MPRTRFAPQARVVTQSPSPARAGAQADTLTTRPRARSGVPASRAPAVVELDCPVPLREASLLELVDELAALARACGQTGPAARLEECARGFRHAPQQTRAAIVDARAEVLAIPGLLHMCEYGVPHERDQARAVALADQLWLGVHTVGADGV
jgi:hypothetical protein